MKLLENLKDEFPQKEKELIGLQSKIGETEKKIDGIDLKVLSEQGRMIVNDLANVEKQIAQFEFEKQKAADEIEKARTEIQELAADSNRLDTDKNNLSDIIEESRLEKVKSDEEREKLEADFRASGEEFDEMVGNQNRLNLEYERLLGEKKNTINAIERAKDSIDTVNRNITKREADIAAFLEETGTLGSIIEEKLLESDDLAAEKTVLKNEEEKLDIAYKEIQNQINELEEKQNSLKNRT